MVGYPLLPTVSISFAQPQLSRWRWLRGQQGVAAVAAVGGGGWEDTGCSSMCYTPTQQDVGCVLRVECTPVAASSGGGAEGQQQVAAAGNGVQQSAAGPAAAAAAAGCDVTLGEAAVADTGEERLIQGSCWSNSRTATAL